jgi:hypothetical protein
VERFVFEVKAVLAGANQSEVFWLGLLKHKDLSGREVASQVSACPPCLPLP